jgi:large subunit ribosomal protein L24
MDTPARSAIEVTYRGEDFAAIKAQFLAEMAEKERKERLMVFDE